jgi:hypothetical protein
MAMGRAEHNTYTHIIDGYKIFYHTRTYCYETLPISIPDGTSWVDKIVYIITILRSSIANEFVPTTQHVDAYMKIINI